MRNSRPRRGRPRRATALRSRVEEARTLKASRAAAFRKRYQTTLFAGAAFWLLKIVGWTLRYRVEGSEEFQRLKSRGEPVIFCFWHEQIFCATHFWRFRGIVVMTSRHLDGEVIARVIERFGYGAARGSSTRGGARALLELKRHLDRGRNVAFTVDGPKGPARQVKSGPLWLSARTGRHILPFHVQPRAFWRLNSWDRFQLPRPFTRVLVKIGSPFALPSGRDPEGWLSRFQEEMDRITRYSEGYWAAGDRGEKRAEGSAL